MKNFKTVIVLVLLFLSSFMASAQLTMDFQNATIVNGGAPLAVGTQYKFPNVTVAPGGINVDCLVTITGSNACTLAGFDDNTSILGTGVSDFNPTIQLNGTTIVNGSAEGAYIDFLFEFVLSSNNATPIFVEFDTYTYDIDGDNGNLREYIEISNFGSYTVNNPTELSYIAPRRFESSTDLVNPGITAADRWLAKASYINNSFFTYRAGVMRDAGVSTTARFVGLAFQPINFSNPVVVQFNADLVTVKTVGFSAPSEGDTIDYQITVTNNGPNDSFGVTATDALPAGVTLVSATSVGGSTNTYNTGGTGVWDIGDLANGATAVLTITVTVDSGTSGTTITNSTTAAEGNENDPSTVGDDLTADITVSNDSDGDGVPNDSDVCNGFDDSADVDNDGVPDGCDLDNDNDGILDVDELNNCPTGAVNTTIVVGSELGRLYETNTITGGATLITTSPFTTGFINSLAANPDNQLYYYGVGTNAYYYEKSTNTHALLGDLSTFPEFAGGRLDSGGGSYLNGVYYAGSETLGAEGDVQDVFAVVLSADGKSIVSLTALNVATAALAVGYDFYDGGAQLGSNGFGDIVTTFVGPDAVIYGSTTHTSTTIPHAFWSFNVATSQFNLISTTNSWSGGQLGAGANGNLYSNVGQDIVRIDPDNGDIIGTAATVGVVIADLTGPIDVAQCNPIRDTDGDGTPDYLDTDSDNDGCFDAIEGGDNILASSVNPDGTLNGTVDSSTGVPSNVNVNSGQTVGTSANENAFDVNGQCDSDNDGVVDLDDLCPGFDDTANADGDAYPDGCDEDDDNDGISDIDEGLVTTPGQPDCGGETTLNFNNAFTEETGDGNIATLLEGESFRFPNVAPGIDALVTIVDFVNISSLPTLDDNGSNPNSFQPQSAFVLTSVGDQAYTEFRFDFVDAGTSTPQIIPTFFANFNDVDGGNRYGEQNWSQLPTDYVVDNPTELLITNAGQWLVGTAGTTEYPGVGNTNPQANYSTEHGGKSSYSIRLGAVARIDGASANGRQHNVEFGCVTNYVNPSSTTSLDTDGDGIPNHLDLDSDGDGCFDALEGNGGITVAQVDANGVILGTINSNGIPNAANSGSGQADVSSTNAAVISDECKVTITIGDVTVDEGDGTATVPVTINEPSALNTVVDIITTAGTAGTSDYTTTTTTVTIPAGATSVDVTVPILDDTINELDEIFTVDGTVTSGNTTNTDPSGTVTIQDNDVTVTIADVTVDEGAGTATVPVTIDTPSSVDTVIDIVTTTGTAGTSDYTTTTTTVTIPAGQTSVDVIIPITDDTIGEPTETFTLEGTVTSGNATDPADGTVTITDNDPVATTIADVTVDEGAGTATVPVTIDTPSSVDTVIDIVTTTGTAGTSDYTTTTTTVTIPAGQTSVDVIIPITDDTIGEPTETFTVEGTVTSGNATDPADGTVTITDNDPVATTIADVTVDEGAGTVTVPVTIDTPSSVDTVIDIVTTTGTAGTSDYTTTTTTVTIPAGQTSVDVIIPITDDTIGEPTETFTVEGTVTSGNATDPADGTVSLRV
ncbi:beta strand repeat-containing protein, partial [Lacinutrix mariniflava]|uniref:beta strand repeat-containing protein n=1 Tax=Lacinutrix mariniflava TaxID=342955 RepID=UPI0013792173